MTVLIDLYVILITKIILQCLSILLYNNIDSTIILNSTFFKYSIDIKKKNINIQKLRFCLIIYLPFYDIFSSKI